MRKLALTAVLVAALTGVVALQSGATRSAAGGPNAPQFDAIDLGTLGGPNTLPNTNGATISDDGTMVGTSETPEIYPYPQWCAGCHAADAYQWRNGVMTDLGTTGGYGAGLFERNHAGVGVGFSETGPLDPQTGDPETHGAISKGGHMIDLGTLGGFESWASAINDRGQVSGFAANTTPDPFAQYLTPYPSATQVRAVVWQDGVVHDLGTLGGPDSEGGLLDESGRAAGWSFTNATPNAATGVPTMHLFLWQHGTMQDLGTLGGALAFPSWLNERGEIAGTSDLAGDQTSHPFLWDGQRLLDLGTLGGDNGSANWVNDGGSVVGSADLPGSQIHHGFLWEAGKMQDLAPAAGAPCSNAYAVNNRDQAVGNATDCHGNEFAAMFWDHGKAYDLNDLIGSSSLYLIEAYYINDRGEIAAWVSLPNGDVHQALLVPASQAPSERLATRRAASTGTRALLKTVHDPRDKLGPLRSRLRSVISSKSPVHDQ